MRAKTLLLVLVTWAWTAPPAATAERHMMQPRVPEEKLEEARALRSPLPASAEVIEQGKGLYQGKGTCFNCHGKTGAGDGIGAMGLNPPPRDFRHHGFWRHRSEGEVFWVIKHGSPGTGMVGFGGMLTDEEIWSIIQYERSFAGEHGPMRGRGPDEGMGRMGPRRGMGREGMGQHGPQDETDPREGQCCEQQSERAQ